MSKIGSVAQVNAYNDLESVWEQQGELDHQSTVDWGDYRVREIAPEGVLGVRNVRVEKNPGGAGQQGVNLVEFVRSRFQTLYPNQDVNERVQQFLNRKKPLLERKIIFASGYACAHDLSEKINAARVRDVEMTALNALADEVRSFAERFKTEIGRETVEAVVTAIEAVGRQRECLKNKTGKDLAKSWSLTLNRSADAKRNDGKEFVDVASEAIMEASETLISFVNLVSKGLKGKGLTEDDWALLERMEQEAASLTIYSRDITALADDMVEILKENDKDASLGEGFLSFTNVSNLDANAFQAVENQLDEISEKMSALFSKETEEGEFAVVRERVSALNEKMAELIAQLEGEAKGGGRAWRQLLDRANEVMKALDGWLDNVKEDESQQLLADPIQKEGNAATARPHLRSPAVLQAVFDGRFDTDFYLECRNRGITDEQIDCTFAAQRFKNRGAVAGKGAFNQVHEQHYVKVGCFNDYETGVFKSDETADKAYKQKLYQSVFGFSDKYHAQKVNFAVRKVATKWFDAPGAVVRSCPTYVKKENGETEYGFVMDKASGDKVADALPKIGAEVSRYAPCEQLRFGIEILLQGCELDWCDWMTGQIDRHAGNTMLDYSVTGGRVHVALCGIDNDLAFGTNRIGLNRFSFRGEVGVNAFINEANRRRGGGTQVIDGGIKVSHNKWPAIDPSTLFKWQEKGGMVMSPESQTVVLDRLKISGEFAPMFAGLGLNSARRPGFITTRMLNRLKVMKGEIEKNETPDPFERDFGDYLPPEALEAMRSRFEELYAYALQLEKDGKCFDDKMARELKLKEDGTTYLEGEVPPADDAEKAKITFGAIYKAVQENVDNLRQSQGVRYDSALDNTFDLGYMILSDSGLLKTNLFSN